MTCNNVNPTLPEEALDVLLGAERTSAEVNLLRRQAGGWALAVNCRMDIKPGCPLPGVPESLREGGGTVFSGLLLKSDEAEVFSKRVTQYGGGTLYSPYAPELDILVVGGARERTTPEQQLKIGSVFTLGILAELAVADRIIVPELPAKVRKLLQAIAFAGGSQTD